MAAGGASASVGGPIRAGQGKGCDDAGQLRPRWPPKEGARRRGTAPRHSRTLLPAWLPPRRCSRWPAFTHESPGAVALCALPCRRGGMHARGPHGQPLPRAEGVHRAVVPHGPLASLPAQLEPRAETRGAPCRCPAERIGKLAQGEASLTRAGEQGQRNSAAKAVQAAPDLHLLCQPPTVSWIRRSHAPWR